MDGKVANRGFGENVRCGSKTEVAQPEWHVGSALDNGHAATATACRLSARN
jgi:hypothetical protein